MMMSKLQHWTISSRTVLEFLKKNDEEGAERVKDKVSCLLTIIENVKQDHGDGASSAILIQAIEALFADSSKVLTLSTVHRAKGLEFPTVYLLDRAKYMPSSWAKQPWQQKQESHLQYVAITRAKERLIHINSDGRN